MAITTNTTPKPPAPKPPASKPLAPPPPPPPAPIKLETKLVTSKTTEPTTPGEKPLTADLTTTKLTADKPLSLMADETITPPPAPPDPDGVKAVNITASQKNSTPTGSETGTKITAEKPLAPTTPGEKPLSLTGDETITPPPAPPDPDGVKDVKAVSLKPVGLTQELTGTEVTPTPGTEATLPPEDALNPTGINPETALKPLGLTQKLTGTEVTLTPETEATLPPEDALNSTGIDPATSLDAVSRTQTPETESTVSTDALDLTDTAPTTAMAAGTAAGTEPNDLPPGIDVTKTPPEVQETTEFVKSVLANHGGEILEDAIKKLNPDMSFENPVSINQVDVTKLKPEQRAAYYLDLKKAQSVNKFLGSQYGDNLYAKSLDQFRVRPILDQRGGDLPDVAIQHEIDGKVRKLEKMMANTGDLGRILNSNVGSWIKSNDAAGYAKIQSTFDTALFGVESGAKYESQSITDAMTGLTTSALLAQTYMAKEDLDAKMPALDKTFHDVVTGQAEKAIRMNLGDWVEGEPTVIKGDGGLTIGGDPIPDKTVRFAQAAPPMPGEDAPPGAYEKWYASLSDRSTTKQIQPLLNESFDKSEIAARLNAAGITEGTDAYNQYKLTFAKDATMQANNYWGTIRRGVKLDVVYSQANTNGMFNKLPHVAGVDADMFRAGAFHTVQNATLSAALAGSILAADGNTSDPKTAMTLTYAASNLADMVLETGSKYLDPKNGAFQKLGLNKDGKWTQSIAKYLPGGDFKSIEAAGKMVAGAGTAVFGATAIWKTVDAVKNGDVPGAIFNGLNAAGSTVAGATLGAEGILQWTNVVKNYATERLGLGALEAAAIDAGARGALASVGWAAGLVAGAGLTALGIYDMAKGTKVLAKGLADADRYITPTTGWQYEFLMNPKLDQGVPV